MSKDLPPSRTADQFVVRFPEGMRDRIASEAKANNRSMNAEILARLEASFKESRTSEDAEEVVKSFLPETAEMMVSEVMEECEVDLRDALVMLLAKGFANQTDAPVFVLEVASGTTLEVAKQLFSSAPSGGEWDRAALFFSRARDIKKTRRLL